VHCLSLIIGSAALCAGGTYDEAFRPQFHFTPKRNWMNDPNGLVYFKGEYHLFFQHNPLGIDGGNTSWGHAVSPDLVHWTELEPVLRPDSDGDIWSGSAVIDWENTAGLRQGKEPVICAFYTASGNPFTQRMAYSTDRGRTFTRYDKNPILGHIVGGNRDPKVFRYAPGKHWVMVLYLDGDEYAIFNSVDLTHWTQTSSLHFPNDGECPDLFELPVDGNRASAKWVFVAGSGRYIIGSFDGKSFVPEAGPFTGDHGAHYYATQTYNDAPDGRRIQIAWMRNLGGYPGMPFNQQMNFPCECTLRTFPDGVRMCRTPVREIEKLRVKHYKWRDVTVSPGENLLAGVKGELFDISATIEVKDAKGIGFRLHGREVTYDPATHVLTALGRTAELLPGDRVSLRILLDRNTLEVYAESGRTVLSSCFIADGNSGLSLVTTAGRVKVAAMDVYELKSAWPK